MSCSRQNQDLRIDSYFSNRVINFQPGGRSAAYSIVDTPEGYVIIGPVREASDNIPGPIQINNGFVRIDKGTGSLDANFGYNNGKTIISFPVLNPASSGTDVPAFGLVHTNGVLALGSTQQGSGGFANQGNLFATVSKVYKSGNDAGKLDTSFGTNYQGQFNGQGLVYQDLDYRGINDEFFDGIVSNNDSIVATGFSNPNQIAGAGPAFNFGVAKFNKDGTFDQSFGVNGRLIIDIIGNSDDRPNGIIELNNKYIVAGRTKIEVANDQTRFYPFHSSLVKFDRSGCIDKTFGKYTQQPYNNLSIEYGKVIQNFGNAVLPVNSMIMRLLKFNNNSFIALGRYGDSPGYQTNPPSLLPLVNKFYVSKYDENGKLDVNFGFNGINAVGIPGMNTVELFSGAIDPCTNYIYAVGRAAPQTVSPFDDSPVIMRFTPNGQLDTSFHASGPQPGVWMLTSTETGVPISFFRSIIVENDGSIVATGEMRQTSANNSASFFTMKFNPQ